MTLDTWLAFFVAAWLICLSPGPGVLSCVTAGLNHGFRAALWNIIGLQAGATVTLIVVGVGLGAVLATSPILFTAIKWFGAGYLVYLGIKQWRSASAPLRLSTADVPLAARSDTPRALFLRGLIVNSTNPKGILFTASVLPQFIDPAAPQLIQFVIVWCTLFFTDVCCMCGYTALGLQALRFLQNPVAARWTNRVFGALFIAAGIGLAVFKHGA